MSTFIVLSILVSLVALGVWAYKEGHFDFLRGSQTEKRESKGEKKRTEKK